MPFPAKILLAAKPVLAERTQIFQVISMAKEKTTGTLHDL
jgi:hypothetical protein